MKKRSFVCVFCVCKINWSISICTCLAVISFWNSTKPRTSYWIQLNLFDYNSQCFTDISQIASLKRATTTTKASQDHNWAENKTQKQLFMKLSLKFTELMALQKKENSFFSLNYTRLSHHKTEDNWARGVVKIKRIFQHKFTFFWRKIRCRQCFLVASKRRKLWRIKHFGHKLKSCNKFSFKSGWWCVADWNVRELQLKFVLSTFNLINYHDQDFNSDDQIKLQLNN